MAQETEIKLRIKDLPAFRRLLKKLGARPISPKRPRVHEHNVIFDTPDNALYKRGQLLRIRREAPAPSARRSRAAKNLTQTVVTFKRPFAKAAPENRHKVREEIELHASDGEALTTIFESLQLRGWFQYEKFRSTFCLPAAKRWAKGLLIELDETPIGIFVELEGPASAIDRVAQELGFSHSDYIVTSYLGLYLEHCRRQGIPPGNMLFTTQK